MFFEFGKAYCARGLMHHNHIPLLQGENRSAVREHHIHRFTRLRHLQNAALAKPDNTNGNFPVAVYNYAWGGNVVVQKLAYYKTFYVRHYNRAVRGEIVGG